MSGEEGGLSPSRLAPLLISATVADQRGNDDSRHAVAHLFWCAPFTNCVSCTVRFWVSDNEAIMRVGYLELLLPVVGGSHFYVFVIFLLGPAYRAAKSESGHPYMKPSNSRTIKREEELAQALGTRPGTCVVVMAAA